MFGWFSPRCPLATREKVWVERRMLWLAERFGIERMRSAPVVLPTDEFFPDPYTHDEPSARRCLDRMCGYMGIAPGSVRLQVLNDEKMPGAVRLYDMRMTSIVFVARSQLDHPLLLLATLSHELAHELLLKGGRLTREEHDHEQVTDLLPVFLGVGVFVANSTLVPREVPAKDGPRWIMGQGYLSSITLGYALALFAFARGEDSPAWASHLRHDAAATLRAGLRYLYATQDTLFHPDTLSGWPASPAPDTLAEWLSSPSASLRFAALEDVAAHATNVADLIPAVERCLKDRDPDVRREAVRTLGAFGPRAEHAVPRLIDAAWHGSPDIQIAACQALGDIRSNPAEVVPALAELLADTDPKVVSAAAIALAAFEDDAVAAEPKLLTAIEAAAAVTDYDRLGHLVHALRTSVPDPRPRLRAYFVGRDPEVQRLALGILKDQGG